MQNTPATSSTAPRIRQAVRTANAKTAPPALPRAPLLHGLNRAVLWQLAACGTGLLLSAGQVYGGAAPFGLGLLLGCGNTYFITPNGLDAADENGSHHTTAEDLARIMKYCIMDSPQKEMFLEITRTPSYQFTDCSGKSTYSCTNHNAFLQMMDGALSGKTGFTGDEG